MKLCVLFIGWLIGPAAGLIADPLRVAWLPRDTQWVAHVNISKIFGTSLGGQRVEEAFSPAIREIEGALLAASGVEVSLKSVFDITVFGRSYDDDGASAVVLAHTSAPVGDFLEKLRARLIADHPESASSFTKERRAGYSVFTTEDDLLAAEILPNRLALAPSVSLLDSTRQALQARSTASASLLAELPDPDEDAALTLLAVGLDRAQEVPKELRILRKAKAVQLDLIHREDRMVSRIGVLTEDPETAELVHSVFRGMLATLRLMWETGPSDSSDLPPSVSEWMRGDWSQWIESGVDRSLVNIELSFPSNVALDTLKKVSRPPKETQESHP